MTDPSLSGTTALTAPQNYLLWKVAQHKHGWSYYSTRRGQWKVADALGARGLVTVSERDLIIEITDAGRAYVAERWPNSPLNLDTYDTPEGGWDKP